MCGAWLETVARYGASRAIAAKINTSAMAAPIASQRALRRGPKIAPISASAISSAGAWSLRVACSDCATANADARAVIGGAGSRGVNSGNEKEV